MTRQKPLRAPQNPAAPRGCQYRRVQVRETSAGEAPADPAPVFRFAVCAASNGRASICAYCTCNTLGPVAAMLCPVPPFPEPHPCDCRHVPTVMPGICGTLPWMLTFYFRQLLRVCIHTPAVSDSLSPTRTTFLER